MSQPIRILLCDDQPVVTEGLQVILSSVNDFLVVGSAANGLEALEQVERLQPNLVVMDLRMPVMNGIQATEQVRKRFPEVRVLILTTYDDDEWVFDAVRAGASGYLLKDAPREQIISAIRGTAAGATHVDPKVAGKLFTYIAQPGAMHASPTVGVELSAREREVLQLLADGLSNADIAERLFLSKGTVQNYVSSLFTQLEVTDRTQAAVLTLRYGLVRSG